MGINEFLRKQAVVNVFAENYLGLQRAFHLSVTG
jgi:hypothetical protein